MSSLVAQVLLAVVCRGPADSPRHRWHGEGQRFTGVVQRLLDERAGGHGR